MNEEEVGTVVRRFAENRVSRTRLPDRAQFTTEGLPMYTGQGDLTVSRTGAVRRPAPNKMHTGQGDLTVSRTGAVRRPAPNKRTRCTPAKET
jgi:hypothetical protein